MSCTTWAAPMRSSAASALAWHASVAASSAMVCPLIRIANDCPGISHDPYHLGCCLLLYRLPTWRHFMVTARDMLGTGVQMHRPKGSAASHQGSCLHTVSRMFNSVQVASVSSDAATGYPRLRHKQQQLPQARYRCSSATSAAMTRTEVASAMRGSHPCYCPFLQNTALQDTCSQSDICTQ